MVQEAEPLHPPPQPSPTRGEGAFFAAGGRGVGASFPLPLVGGAGGGGQATDAQIFPFASLDRFVPTQFSIRIATETWELAGCRALRRSVFCDEQNLFARDDRDAIDDIAITLAAISWVAVAPDQVVGTVRIHESEPGIWFGSRLAVDRACRRVGGIGTELIRLAVGTAHARGARAFFAHVQQANVKLFQSLHWRSLESVSLHGHPHDLMRADLAHYPPHHAGDISLLRPLKAAA